MAMPSSTAATTATASSESSGQDRGLIGVAQQRALPLDPAGDPRPQQVAGHERHQQLQHDAADGMQRIVDAAGGAGQCGQQQRGQEHTEDARQRSTAHRCGYVAARHRSERDGRLHGGGQGAQEQHAQVQLRGQQPAGQRRAAASAACRR
ncbi:hypothetical protein G6F32_014915 [Rhizopus arrhizus]|nr:hypothetical protein G6F32_014915 [Rhizopus arrhizus]